jgi:drug/metabolite transporter (DMT)-like permease
MMVMVAFATVYLVWGSTYFFIRLSVAHIPPMLVGCMRFLLAGVLMLVWCLLTGEKVFVWRVMRPAIVSGLLLLFFGNGALIWSEQYVTSSLAAILLAGGPIWFVVLDKGKWSENFRSRETIIGLLVGLAGVMLLFGEQLLQSFAPAVPAAGAAGVVADAAGVVPADGHNWSVIALVVLLLGSISWAAGSLYSKYKAAGNSNSVNAGWQMLAAGVAFIPAGLFSGEWSHFHWREVPMSSWLAIFYLVTMGSLAGYSAFVWLLQVRSATQVSTHAYVNPVVAVLLGVFFADEKMSPVQLLGLFVILVSVLLINLAKYRASHTGLKKSDGLPAPTPGPLKAG